MKKRFSLEQIVAVLKQAELGVAVPDVIRKVGIRPFYRWKKQYAGMETDQARQLKQLQLPRAIEGSSQYQFYRPWVKEFARGLEAGGSYHRVAEN